MSAVGAGRSGPVAVPEPRGASSSSDAPQQTATTPAAAITSLGRCQPMAQVATAATSARLS